LGFLTSIFDIINVPLGYLFRYIYMVLQDYGWTIVVFTLITKAILLPLTIKQQKSTAKMQAMQPKLQELQKKYQYDKEKLNQETMKLYQDSGVNPMGGCLPLLIQFPLLIALYNIIRQPLNYVIQLGKHGLPNVEQVYEALKGFGMNPESIKMVDQIGIASKMSEFAAELAEKFPGAGFLNINFNSFGLNLAQYPNSAGVSWLLIIPVLAAASTLLVSWLTTKMNGQPKSANSDNPANSMQMMTYIFPVMTFFFSYTMPAGLGFYWIISNLVQLLQQVIMKYCFPAKPSDEPARKNFREREAEKAERRKK